MSGCEDLISFSMAASCACVSWSCVWASSVDDMVSEDCNVLSVHNESGGGAFVCVAGAATF